MQASVPDLMDMSKEPQSVLDMYGASRAMDRLPRIACSRGGWRSAACGSSSFIIATGTITQE